MIGRLLLYTAIALLALFVLGSTFVLRHGGGYTSDRPPVTIHDLRLLPEAYKDKTVTTEGTLHYSPDLDQYEIVDSDRQAVVLQGYEEGELQKLLEKTVTVTGRFGIARGIGIYIDVDFIGAPE